jgi:hypothetical protein
MCSTKSVPFDYWLEKGNHGEEEQEVREKDNAWQQSMNCRDDGARWKLLKEE